MNQVTVGATDFDASVRFYCALGLRLIVSARSEYARFELPEGEATFSIHLQDHVSPEGPIIYFEVDDVDATAARFKAQGGTLVSEPQDQPWLWREARLLDPSGNRLCLFHAGPNRRNPPWRIDTETGIL
ncbi:MULTISPECIES: VOC family protein [unclassified Sphingomonas]|uniref:VOC family protein n=1 Tax=unclassified Sphingomonas TaxID=196159 RepID=UPI00285E3F96|nr:MULTISPECIES: VOC family protein [unclassified Sphingomonas]MDR6114825.1 putative enzyme related to lactoylglutathione lyase [Sphingomonas sp. SORGH_AS_0789]MDR6151502.1 putative enzyme related to lactoylglutathione lyase [Sphingomonas sp. SORGH_AS_0742]